MAQARISEIKPEADITMQRDRSLLSRVNLFIQNVFRITQDDFTRITEDGDSRILDEA